MRQQLREAVKWVLTGHLVEDTGWGVYWQGSILKLLLTVVGGNFPIIVVMIPQESGIGAGGSLSKNWPRRPRHYYKISHWRQLRLLILEVIIHGEWIYSREIQWRGLLKWVWGVNCWDWTYATISLKFLFLWVGLDYWGNLTNQVA